MVRYEFADETVTEKSLHPEDIYTREQELAYNFVHKIKKQETKAQCPVCDQALDEVLFEKWGYAYYLCPNDWSLSLCPGPGAEIHKKYFFDSEIARFRSSKAYQDQISQNRRDLWENLVVWIESRITRYLGTGKYDFLEWGPKNVGWLEALQTASCLENIHVKYPLPPVNDKDQNADKAHVVCLVDVLQKETSPQSLLQEVYNNLDDEGLLIITCRSGSGFDVLTLRGASKSIFPLDHIFLPSPQGLRNLLQTNGFEVLEVTTPGMLDVSYVASAENDIPTDQHFQRYLMKIADQGLYDRLQGFLQRNNLSSHLRCVARKLRCVARKS